MAELSAWAAYFQAKHQLLPAWFLYLERRQVEAVLVPCQWPEWFDSEYRPPQHVPRWPPPDTTEIPTDESRRRIDLHMQDLRRAIGLGKGKYDPNSQPVEPPPPIISDEELLRLYPPRVGSAA